MVLSKNHEDIKFASAILETHTINNDSLVYYSSLLSRLVMFTPEVHGYFKRGFSCRSRRNTNLARYLFHEVRKFLERNTCCVSARKILIKLTINLKVEEDPIESLKLTQEILELCTLQEKIH